MTALPQHEQLLKPYTWTADMAHGPLEYGVQLHTVSQALANAAKTAKQSYEEKLRTRQELLEAEDDSLDHKRKLQESEIPHCSPHLADDRVEYIKVPLELSPELAGNPLLPHLLTHAELLGNLALNPEYKAEEKQPSVHSIMAGFNGTDHSTPIYPLWQQMEMPECLRHGVIIQKEKDGYSALFLSKDLKQLLGGAETEPYAFDKRLDDMLQQWHEASILEMLEPQKRKLETDSILALRTNRGADFAKKARVHNMPHLEGTQVVKKIEDEYWEPQRVVHKLAGNERLELIAQGWSPLKVSIKDQREDYVKYWLGEFKAGRAPDCNPNPIRDTTAYEIACECQDVRMLRFLAHYGEKPTRANAIDSAIAGNVEVLNTMLELGAKLNRYSLANAIKTGKADMVEAVSRLDQNTLDQPTFKTAIDQGNDSIFAQVLLLAKKQRGLMSLLNKELLSAIQNKPVRMDLLMEALPAGELGKPAWISGVNTAPLLRHAVCENRTQEVRWLFDAGATMDTDNPPLLLIAVFHGNAELCKLLMDKGADPKQLVCGNISYFTFIKNGKPKQKSVQINPLNQSDDHYCHQSPVGLAAALKEPDVMNVFLDRTARPDPERFKRPSPLSQAAKGAEDTPPIPRFTGGRMV